MSNPIKTQIYDVLSGKIEVRNGKVIQAIANHPRESQRTSAAHKGTKLYKEQERQELEAYISRNQLWINYIDFDKYVSEGAEQKVYLKKPKNCTQVKRFYLLQFLGGLFS